MMVKRSSQIRNLIVLSAVIALVLETIVPFALAKLGFERAALLSIWPGLLPIAWATGGFFAGITPFGYLLMYSINTLVYGAPIFLVILCCDRKRNAVRIT